MEGTLLSPPSTLALPMATAVTPLPAATLTSSSRKLVGWLLAVFGLEVGAEAGKVGLRRIGGVSVKIVVLLGLEGIFVGLARSLDGETFFGDFLGDLCCSC